MINAAPNNLLKKPFFLLFLIVFSWLIIPPVAKSFITVSFSEFHAPVWTARAYMQDLQDFWGKRTHTHKELIESGRDLARKLSFEELNRLENAKLKEENRRLLELLELPSHLEYRYEVARVIRRSTNSWWQQLTIRKGRNFNIPIGAAVVYSGGVVGRIKEVNAYTATVELITSPNFRMTARFEDDTRPVTYQGSINLPFHPPIGMISNVQRDILVDPGNPRKIHSSNWGGTFPAGLLIGTVAKLDPGSDDLFQSGQVILDERLLALYEVAVLIPIVPEEDD